MAKITVECDACGARGDDIKFFTDYDDFDRCEKCHLKHEIECLEIKISDMVEWLKNTHHKDLREMGIELKKLRIRLRDLNNGEND